MPSKKTLSISVFQSNLPNFCLFIYVVPLKFGLHNAYPISIQFEFHLD